ncbi:ABC transporter permease [Candidatus Bathyarchaeota archaeon]|nr:MAG: ABC transporter permease [Candidatus Bathyarchaeota archaeon]
MEWKDVVRGLKGFWNEYKRYKSGLLGLVMLVVLAFMAIGTPLLAPEEACRNWDKLQYWEENPSAVPPAWVDWFTPARLPGQQILSPSVSKGEPVWVVKDGDPVLARPVYITFTYEFCYDEIPDDVKLDVEAYVAWRPGARGLKPASLTITVLRPDGRAVTLYRNDRYVGSAWIEVSTDSSAREALTEFAKMYDTPENIARVRPVDINPVRILFSEAKPGIILGQAPLLRGTYVFQVYIEFYSDKDYFESARLVVCGAVYGPLGTDIYGRDLWVGLVWGSRLALLIGLVTAVVSTVVGVIYGVVSAYAGGLVDEVMQRIVELVSSIPLLPILIILSYYMEPSIWNLALIMGAFYWVGPVKTVRSMALQIKEEPYVEAARAIGVGRWRLITRYIAAQVMPYTFAVMALSVPGAILTEAAISFLLGGLAVRELTWGKILHDAREYVLSGMWWWILPPGFMICFTGLAFVLVGNALDKILNPMLKR